MASHNSEYPNVKLDRKPGTLSLTPQGFGFEPNDHSDGYSHFWPWDSVKGSYFSVPASACIHGAKFVFKDNEAKDPIIFMFPNREEFERVEQDVADHGLTVAPLKMTGTLWGGH